MNVGLQWEEEYLTVAIAERHKEGVGAGEGQRRNDSLVEAARSCCCKQGCWWNGGVCSNAETENEIVE